MVYANKLSAAIKVNGKVLRESSNIVTLPFGSEYSILIKNLNSVRVQVKVSVDGTDATEGTWLVIGPNSSLELERFIRNSNWSSGNRFKFIERTEGIEKHRGVQIDDGLIRIEYQTERLNVVNWVNTYYNSYPTYPWPSTWPYTPWYTLLCKSTQTQTVTNTSGNVGCLYRQGASPQTETGACGQNTQNVSLCSMNNSMSETSCSVQDQGITVPGSESNQQFHSVSSFPLETGTSVLVLQLRGVVAGQRVVKAVTVKTKKTCSTCGKTSKSHLKFCSGCGTALTLI